MRGAARLAEAIKVREAMMEVPSRHSLSMSTTADLSLPTLLIFSATY